MLLNIQFTEHININIVQVVFFPGRELLGAKQRKILGGDGECCGRKINNNKKK